MAVRTAAMPEPLAPQEPLSPRDFATHARRVADRVCRAVRAALRRAQEIKSAPGVQLDFSKPQNAARALGLDKSLAWKVVRLSEEPETLSALSKLPGRPGQQILFGALARAGVEDHLLRELQESLDEYEQLVLMHAGDRETLEVMLAQIAPTNRAREDEASRRLAFQGHCAVWGVQARTQVTCHFVSPKIDDPDKLIVGVYSGLVGMRRLRENATWAVAAARVLTDDGAPMSWQFAPLDPAITEPEAPPLLREFCSDPSTVLRQRVSRGIARLEMVGGPVGRAGEVDCFIGYSHRAGLNRYAEPQNFLGQHFTTLSTPAETLILDLAVHRSLEFAMNPQVTLHNLLPCAPPYPGEGFESGVVPLHESWTKLESPAQAGCPEYPRLAELMTFAAGRTGHAARDFAVFRLRLAYPPIPTMLVYRYPLPDRSKGER